MKKCRWCWFCHRISLWLFKKRGAVRVKFPFATGWRLGNRILFEYDNNDHDDRLPKSATHVDW